MPHDRYENPLISRYASVEMAELFSPQRKFSTWRRIWIALAQAQQELGLGVTTEQIDQLQEHVDNIDFDMARQYENKLRHDVMAHVHAYGDVCPDARPIIHLGATSCFVTDNTDLIILREALVAVRSRLAAVIDQLGTFAAETKNLATLGFTHLQPAQPTTVGKRACLWAYDLALDLEEVVHRIEGMQARSTKGTTGTQASFLKLLDGDHAKVKALELSVAEKLGFTTSYAVTGQTYSRKIDSQILDVLSGIAQSSHKAASDFRLLANRKELEEPFEKEQIGSSAMAYKRNPMRSERICSLARFVMSLQSSAANTMATQWMERTLDDSANRRLVLPQAFLATDAVLILYQNVTSGLVTYPQVIAKNLQAELPFMATENILMSAVAAGGDRQDLHERIRQHSLAAADRIKQQGEANDLMSRLASDEAFASVDLEAMTDASQFVGRAPEQVAEFIEDVVEPVRAKYVDGAVTAEVNV
ncbi:MAG: adenylosuccinate lyase [Planctomycetaceae bacterium]|jgi:adenylosuccinate lyase|nr:adenylosuccinate lyase [Planctomycetaceae bacterium]